MTPSVAEYFEGKHVLLTGITGFVGKCLLEKLLRSCPGVGKVSCVVRPKKGLSSKQRLTEALHSQIFDRLRLSMPATEVFSKVELIPGEMTQPDFGLQEQELEILTKSVHILIHYVAHVSFKIPLRKIVRLNVGGTRNILKTAVSMPNLQAFVFISTAYSSPSNTPIIKERIYTTGMDPELLLNFLENAPKAWCNAITSLATSGFRSTYAYSAHLAEKLVESYTHKIPICIIRPGMILAAYEEPFPGWNAIGCSTSKFYKYVFDGFYFSPNCDPATRPGITPVDYLVNFILCAVWKLGCRPNQGILVYNNAKTEISNQKSFRIGAATVRKNRYNSLVWYPNPEPWARPQICRLTNVIFRLMPAVVYDRVFRPENRKSMVKTIRHSLQLNAALQGFCSYQFVFGPSRNTQALVKELSEEDRRNFPLDLDMIDWEKFFRRFAAALHTFDPDEKDDTPASAARMFKLRAIDLGLKFSVLLICVSLAVVFYLFGHVVCHYSRD